MEETEVTTLEEAVQIVYRRGGEEVSQCAEVSKQTVKNKFRQLELSKTAKKSKEMLVEYLHIDANKTMYHCGIKNARVI